MTLWKLIAAFFLLEAFSCGIAHADQMDFIVNDLLRARDFTENGTCPNLGLPKTATTDQVIDKVLEITMEYRRITKYKISFERHVEVSPDDVPWTAVAIESNIRPIVVLIRYVKDGWRFRMVVDIQNPLTNPASTSGTNM